MVLGTPKTETESAEVVKLWEERKDYFEQA